jgi:hypothetical protein
MIESHIEASCAARMRIRRERHTVSPCEAFRCDLFDRKPNVQLAPSRACSSRQFSAGGKLTRLAPKSVSRSVSSVAARVS